MGKFQLTWYLSKTDRYGVTGETGDVGSDLEAVGFPANLLEGYQVVSKT